jgi:type I restriction enzyme, S subunit
VSRLPHGWRLARLSDVARIVTGNTPPTAEPANYGGDVPFAKPPQLRGGPIGGTEQTLSARGLSVARVVPADTTLISCIGNLGKVGLTNKPTAFNQQINAVLFGPEVRPKFGFYACQRLGSYLESVASATTIPIVNKSKLSQASIPVPPLQEQDLIVSEIEKHFTRLDAAVATLKHVETRLAAYRASVLETAAWGSNGQSALSTGILPTRWHWQTLKDVSEFSDYGTSEKCDYAFNGPPVVRIPNIVEGRLDLNDLKRAKSPGPSRPQPLGSGDFLIIRTNGSKNLLGRAALVTENGAGLLFASYLIRFRLTGDSSLLHWVARIWDSPSIRRQVEANAASSAGQHNISTKPLERIRFPVPPAEMRAALLADVEQRLTLAAALSAESQRSVRRAAAIRRGILTDAFSGQMTSRDNTHTLVDSTP